MAFDIIGKNILAIFKSGSADLEYVVAGILKVYLHRLFLTQSLRKKCPYSEFFWSVFYHIRTEYGQILRRDQMQKNTDRKNSKYGHFSRSDCFSICWETHVYSRMIYGIIITWFLIVQIWHGYMDDLRI